LPGSVLTESLFTPDANEPTAQDNYWSPVFNAWVLSAWKHLTNLYSSYLVVSPLIYTPNLSTWSFPTSPEAPACDTLKTVFTGVDAIVIAFMIYLIKIIWNKCVLLIS